MKIKSLDILRNSQGFGLLEVLIALSILTVGMLGVMGMQLMATSGTTFGRELQTAILVGQEVIEAVKSMENHSPNLTPGYHNSDNPNDTIDHVVIPDPSNPGFRFTREWNVYNGPISNAQEIAVTVTWPKKMTSNKTDKEEQINKISLYTSRMM